MTHDETAPARGAAQPGPGPWRFQPACGKDISAEIVRVRDGQRLARIEVLPCDPPGSDYGAEVAAKEERRVARLMTAAPLLLEALETMLAPPDWTLADLQSGVKSQGHARQLARAAIRAAKGEV